MRTMQKYLLLLLLPVMFGLTSCKKDESNPTTPPAINETETLISYLEGQGDYMHSGFVIAAADYKTAYVANPARVYTIDIRSAADYTNKHLKGAKNVAVADLLTHVNSINFDNFDKVVVACYSGQTAAYAVGVVRATLPFAKATKLVSLKWGMSSIDSMFAQTSWLAKRGNGRAANFITTDSPAKPAKGELPSISTGKTAGADIAAARAQALLTEGYSAATINDATLYTNLSNYFIANYWPVALYKLPGHIDGAINFDPAGKPWLMANDLKSLPKDKDIVLYCYTGQTSSYLAAYLRMFGYKAKSLLYGGNGIIYELMKANNVANTFIPENEIKGYKDLLE